MDYERIAEAVSEPFSENLRKLQELFPSVVKDGEVDFDALRAELGEFTEIGKERYELTWAGKQDAQLLTGEPLVGKTLKYVAEESKNPETTENLYIEGDNLEALKLLQNSYRGKIKMIYIDPPYNTGNDFVYNDNFAVSDAESQVAEGVRTEEGERLAVNPKSSAKYHANWLSMMYPRLRLARDLLRDDGVIFISIDDNEVGNLRVLCDDVFGGNNFVANFPWRKRTAKSDVPHGVSQDYEWIMCYAKSDRFTAGVTGPERKYFETPDFPGRPWRIHDLTTQKTASERPNSAFTMINPKTGAKYPVNPLRTWAVTKETFVEYYADNRIVFPGDYDFLNISKPAFRYWKEDDKNKAGEWFGLIPASTKLPETVGMSLDGTKDIISLFDGKIFSFPKTVSLIKFFIDISSKISNDSIVLDFFSGSATTAHAVMQLNAEDGGNRKFIMVQLPEICAEDSEAYKAGYQTICEIGKERIRRVGEKIKAENPLAELDVGFKVFKVDDTNIRWIAAESGKQGITLEDALSAGGKDLRDFMNGTNDIDVVYEILIRQYGIPLTAPIELLSDIGERTYSIADTVIVCLEEDVTDSVIDKIANLEPIPQKIVFRDSAFGDNISLKENAMLRLDALMQKHAVGGRQPYSVEFL